MGLCLLLILTALFRAGAAITPKELIELPQRSQAIASPSGELAVLRTTTYSLENHDVSASLSLLNISSGALTDLPFDAALPGLVFAGPTNTSILYLNQTDSTIRGGVELWISDLLSPLQRTRIAALEAKVTKIKAATKTDGSIQILLECNICHNGTALKNKLDPFPYSEARFYGKAPVATMEGGWRNGTQTALFSALLEKHQRSYVLTSWHSILNPMGLQKSGVAGYDLSRDGEAVSVGLVTGSALRLFLFPTQQKIPENAAGHLLKSPKNSTVLRPGVFSPNGRQIAYVSSPKGIDYARYEIIVLDLNSNWSSSKSVLHSKSVAKGWEREPELLKWNVDGSRLLAVATDSGELKMYSIVPDTSDDYRQIASEGSVLDFDIMQNGSLLVSYSSLLSPTGYKLLHEDESSTDLFSPAKEDKALSGISHNQLDSFNFTGSSGLNQRAWIIKPVSFSAAQRYPVILAIHGGPMKAWYNAWDVSSNLKVFADQGYVVIAPDITGSIGYGYNFTDSVVGELGGRPYEDLVLCYEAIAQDLPYINVNSSVAMGSSYGGYMVNWIQGNALGRNFSTLVSVAGIASWQSTYATDSTGSSAYFGGDIWKVPKAWRQFDVLPKAANFSTPELVVHGGLDVRVPFTEGVTMFQALQKQGVQSRFLYFPDERHGVLKPENLLVYFQETFNWINHWTENREPLDNNTVELFSR